FLSLPNFAPEVFVHARRHVFVVRIRDVFAYRLRVLEAVTANAAMPLVAGEDVRTPLGAFRVVFGIGHFQILTLLEDQSPSSDRLSNLLVVGSPLQLSRWVEAIPASNSLAAATGNGAFWPRQETTSGTMRSRRRQGGRHDGSGLRPA